MLIERNEYINQLQHFKDKELIKVITGIRRCGKSTLLDIYENFLLNEGIAQEQIIRINLEDLQYHFITNYMELYNYINDKLLEDKMNYVFIDEVQNINEFQKAVDSLYIKKNVDVYITGSNAYLLSSELATLLSGRYIEIKMLPLSFKEFASIKKYDNLERLYQEYISRGGFPYTLSLDNEDDINRYINEIFNSTIIKDILLRKKIQDESMLKSVVYFTLDNIGNRVSTNNIANTMISNGRKINVRTVESYLNSLVESFMFYKVERYDIKGKQYLKTGDKYFVSDLGFRYFLLGRKFGDYGHILENVIYLELLRRGYEVYIGKVDEYEIDFIAINSEGKEYYQIAETLKGSNILEREIRPLKKANDNYPKTILTLDVVPNSDIDGIKIKNALDWLVNEK